MKVALDKGQFRPWALVTGAASSGVGKEFARQIASSGINVVLFGTPASWRPQSAVCACLIVFSPWPL
jgi:hypothetical protein